MITETNLISDVEVTLSKAHLGRFIEYGIWNASETETTFYMGEKNSMPGKDMTKSKKKVKKYSVSVEDLSD